MQHAAPSVAPDRTDGAIGLFSSADGGSGGRGSAKGAAAFIAERLSRLRVTSSDTIWLTPPARDAGGAF